ncbi:MAG: hypothetical protein AB1430_08540 [Pseudomonadota bacterium]
MNPPADERPLHALNRVLESLEAVRNGRALYVLLASFALGGLLLAMARAALLRGAPAWGVLDAGLALTVAFYGGNAAGLLLMDQARAQPSRGVGRAVRDALGGAHRLIVVLLAVGLAGLVLVAALAGLLWISRVPVLGTWLFGLVVPLGVVLIGAAVLTTTAVVGPLAAPAIWSGLSVRATLAFLQRQVRQRLFFAALLNAAVGLLAAAVAALVSFAVLSGGRAVAGLAVLVTGVELPPQQLLAGLFGFGLRTLGPSGAAVAQNPYGAAALVGGGLVFALVLVLPAVVYLRGTCSVFLALQEADALRAAARDD